MRFLVLAVLVACSGPQDVRVHFPAPPEAPTGILVLHLSQPANNVSVAVNGVLMVDNAHTSSVTIDGVPVGTSEIVMAAEGMDKQFNVWVAGDHATTVPLGVAEPGVSFLKTLAGSLLTIIVYSLLHH
jgi:hypothetical protein